MKRLLLVLVVCALALAVSVNAQSSVRVGVKLGPSFASMSGAATEGTETKMKAGLTAGLFAEFGLSEFVSFQPEALLVMKGVKKEYSAEGEAMDPISVTENVKLVYLQMPILAKIKIPTKGKIAPHFLFGPALSFNLSGKDDVSGYGDANVDGDFDIANVKSMDFSGIIGFGVDFPVGSVRGSAEVRYDKGFGTAFDDIDDLNSVPDGEVPFVDFDFDPGSEEPTGGTAEDLKNGGFSFTFAISVPIGGQ